MINYNQRIDEMREIAKELGFMQELDYIEGYNSNFFNEDTITIDYYHNIYNVFVSLVISKYEFFNVDVEQLKGHLRSRMNVALSRSIEYKMIKQQEQERKEGEA